MAFAAHGALAAALEADVGLAEGGGRQREVGAGDGTDLDPVEGLGTIRVGAEQREEGGLGGRAPEVVEDHVDIGGLGGEVVGDLVGIGGQVQRGRGAEGGEDGQLLRVSARGDDGLRSEVPGDLDGELAGGAGGAEDEDALAGVEGHPAVEGNPGGHAGVHGGGEDHRVGVGRERDGAAEVDCRGVGHGAVGGVGEDEVHERVVGPAADAVDARDEGQLPRRRVVRAIGLRADARVQAGGQDVHELVVLPHDRRDRDLLVGRWAVELADDGGVHPRALLGGW